MSFSYRVAIRRNYLSAVRNSQPDFVPYTVLGHTYAEIEGDTGEVSLLPHLIILSSRLIDRCHTLVCQYIISTPSFLSSHQPPHVPWYLIRLVTCSPLLLFELFLDTILMNSSDSTIKHKILKISILLEFRKNALPACAFKSTVIAGKDSVSVAKIT